MINGSNMVLMKQRMKMSTVHLIIIFSLSIIGVVQNSVIRQEGEQAQSLYDSNDKVFVLTHENFYQSVYDQPYASNVEFYNSFCGFCRNFAPIYKEWANDVYGWRDVVRISAIDCADDANNDICRDMEIMRYPTLKYYPPFYRNETNHLGIEVQHAPMTVGEPYLIELMANSTNAPSSWPNLTPIEASSPAEFFASLPNHVEYVFMVWDPKNDSIVAQKVALDLNAVSNAQIRQITSPTGFKFGLNVPSAVYVGVKSSNTIQLAKHLGELDRASVRSTIEEYLKSQGVHINLGQNSPSLSPRRDNGPTSEVNDKDSAIIKYVKSHEGIVFQADLESAIRFSIFHELVKYNNMNDDQITAMKRYLSVLQKYSPLGDNGQLFLTELNEYVNSETGRFNGKVLSDKIKDLEKKYQPMFSSSRWIGCRPSVFGRRGFSCGLWQLFHYLTVQASNSERSHDALEVLQAIHGFVKHYFGCTHCSKHFQEMADRNGIWKVTTKEEAVLWLWAAHNEVNNRLAGDQTEDPAFPKIQYPSHDVCTQCYQQVIPIQGVTPSTDTPHWDRVEVLYYLRRVYSLFNLSRYGVDDESVLPQLLTNAYSAKLQSSTNSGYSSAFSEMDVRMGMLLYAFCMLIIVVAVKLFLQRGYRKKIYTHDFLGKI